MVEIKIIKPIRIGKYRWRSRVLTVGEKITCKLENDFAVFYFGCCGNQEKIILDPEYFEIIPN